MEWRKLPPDMKFEKSGQCFGHIQLIIDRITTEPNKGRTGQLIKQRMKEDCRLNKELDVAQSFSRNL